MQLTPTANISLVEDVNAKLDDGSYKFPEPPSVEAQHAIKVFGAIPHIFELRGTKRFKPGDPLIDLLGCMRAGQRISQRIWKKSSEPVQVTAAEYSTLGTMHQSSNEAPGCACIGKRCLDGLASGRGEMLVSLVSRSSPCRLLMSATQLIRLPRYAF